MYRFMCLPRKSLETSYVRNKTSTDYSDARCSRTDRGVSARCERACISVMNTQWHPVLEILGQGQRYLPSYPVPRITPSHLSPPLLPAQWGPSCLPRVPRSESYPLFTQSEGLFWRQLRHVLRRGPSVHLGGCERRVTCHSSEVGSRYWMRIHTF